MAFCADEVLLSRSLRCLGGRFRRALHARTCVWFSSLSRLALALHHRYTNNAFGYGSVVVGGHYNKVGSIVDDDVLNITYATGAYGFVGAGWANTAQGHYTSVVGGNSNTARGSYSNIAGGYANSAHGYAATIGGGHVNTAGGATEIAGNYATIGGGWGNEAFGHFTGEFSVL